MKYVPIAVSRVVARQLLHAQKHSPAIMLGAGIATGVLATIQACKATLKVEDILNEGEHDLNTLREITEKLPHKYPVSELPKREAALRVRTVRKVAKIYTPAAVMGLASIGLLTGSHIVLTRRNAGLAAAYAVLDRGFREYRDRVRSELGPEKDQEFRYGSQQREIVEEDEHGHEVKTVKRHNTPGRSIYARLFDDGNQNWRPNPLVNRTFIQCQQSYANDKLRANGHIFLNEVYDMLGMQRSPEGQVVGWVIGGRKKGDGFVEFGLESESPAMRAFMDGDESSVLLDFNVDGNIWDLI